MDPLRDLLHYYAEPLPGGRAQLVFEAVFDGCIVQHYPVGSPAPLDVIKQHERIVKL